MPSLPGTRVQAGRGHRLLGAVSCRPSVASRRAGGPTKTRSLASQSLGEARHSRRGSRSPDGPRSQPVVSRGRDRAIGGPGSSRAARGGPMHDCLVGQRDQGASRSAVEYTATASTPSSWQVARCADGDLAAVGDQDRGRLADGPPLSGSSSKSSWPYSTGWAFSTQDPADDRRDLGLDLVHQLHRLEDAEHLPDATRSPSSTKAGARVEATGRTCRPSGSRPDRRGHLGSAGGAGAPTSIPTTGATCNGRSSCLRTVIRSGPSSTVISPTPELLHHPDRSRSGSARRARPPPPASPSPRRAQPGSTQERLGLLAEEREEQQSSSLAASSPGRERRSSMSTGSGSVAAARPRAPAPGRSGPACGRSARERAPQLVDDRRVAARGEHVDERLRARSRRSGRRAAASRARRGPARPRRAPRRAGRRVPARRLGVDHRDEPTGGACAVRTETRGSSGLIGMSPTCSSTSRRRLPDRSTSTPGSWPSPGERLRERLGRDPVGRERDRVDRSRDQVDARAGGLEREREPVAAGALGVEPDRQPRELARARRVAGAVRARAARPGRRARSGGADLGQPAAFSITRSRLPMWP